MYSNLPLSGFTKTDLVAKTIVVRQDLYSSCQFTLQYHGHHDGCGRVRFVSPRATAVKFDDVITNQYSDGTVAGCQEITFTLVGVDLKDGFKGQGQLSMSKVKIGISHSRW